jgi:hypothetical protein
MPKFRRYVTVSVLSLSLAGMAQPASAQIRQCLRETIDDCADAMEGSNWFERWALGVFCSALLAACANQT